MSEDRQSAETGGRRLRSEHAAERRANLCEAVKNIVLSTQAQRWRYEFLRKNDARNQRGLRKDLDNWLPELESLPRSDRETVDAVASFEMWNRLREHQGLSKKASMKIVKGLLKNFILGGALEADLPRPAWNNPLPLSNGRMIRSAFTS